MIYENYKGNKYVRITQYTIQSVLIFTGKHEFYLDKLDKDFIKKVTSPAMDVSAPYLEGISFKKQKIARIAAESYYTVISRNYIREELIALSWEIYELPTILKIYKEKKSHLEYWLSERRE